MIPAYVLADSLAGREGPRERPTVARDRVELSSVGRDGQIRDRRAVPRA